MKVNLVVKSLCIRLQLAMQVGTGSRRLSDQPEIHQSHSCTVFTLKMATVLCALFASAANAAGDPERGARSFQACMICHSVNAGEHSTGPSLASLMSRKAGTAEGFPRYSQALKDANITWNENNLDQWLSDPRRFIPGTSMAVKGIKDAQERADVIAYLKAVSENIAPALPQQDGVLRTSYRRAP